jgi:hypothetical protein
MYGIDQHREKENHFFKPCGSTSSPFFALQLLFLSIRQLRLRQNFTERKKSTADH